MKQKSFSLRGFKHMKSAGLLLLAGVFAVSPAAFAASSSFQGDGFVYDWETVNVGAGGFVTGLDFADDGSLAVKTDVGGAYVWESGRMEQLLTTDAMPSEYSNPEDGDGVYEVVFAPSNSNIMYMYWFDRLFKSTDRGGTFTELTDFGTHTGSANGSWRTHNNRLAVDPINPDVLYVGTEDDGLFVTFDGGANFSHVATVTNGGGDRGITAITFDRGSGATGGRTNTVYAASYGNGLYRTTNAGTSWAAVSGAPTDISDMEIQSNGNLYVADPANSTVREYVQSGPSWNNMNPSHPGSSLGGSAGEFTLALDPTNDDRLFVMNEAGSLTYTLNGGSSWNSGNHNREASDIPWLEWVDESWFSTAEIALNPTNPNELWLAQGLGVWMLDVSGNPSGTFDWQSRNLGIEELVTRSILSIEGRDRVILPAMDRPIFVSDSNNEFPSVVHPADTFSNGWSVANSSTDPDYVVALVSDYMDRSPLNAVFSTDGGGTWTSFPDQPGPAIGGGAPYWGSGGNIAVGAPGNVVVVPSSDNSTGTSTAYYTTDGGNNWDPVTGLPDALITNRNFARHILTADGDTPGTFYAFDSDGSSSNTVYRSTDGGANWSAAGVPAGAVFTQYNGKLRSVPGQAGELYFTAGHQSAGGAGGNPYDYGTPLYHSDDGGDTWTTVPNMTEVYDIGFGATAPGQSYPSMFVAGFYNHVWGIWRSFDGGATWTQIGDTPTDVINRVSYISGDMNDPNCTYIGFSGIGWAKGCVRGASTTDPSDDDSNGVGGELTDTGTSVPAVVAFVILSLGIGISLHRRNHVYRLRG